MNFSLSKQSQIREATQQQPSLRGLSQVIFTGWPESIRELPTELREFWNFRDELAVEDGIIFKGKQVLIPELFQKDILQQLHSSHQGVEKTRLLARETVYWPGVNKDIDQLCKQCKLCQENLPQQPREPMVMHEKPAGPWIKLGIDLFEVNGKPHLIIADYYSKYPIIKQMSSTTSSSIISAIKAIIGLFGIPREIVSDNGPQFLSEFNLFCNNWGIRHNTSSPRHPRSNGFIERQIRYLKPVVKKCILSGQDITKAMLNIRATPIANNMPSPAEIMFGRQITTGLPSRQTMAEYDKVSDHLHTQAWKQKSYADMHTKALQPLLPSAPVSIWNDHSHKWEPGQIDQQLGPRSYTIQKENGSVLRRNRVHIRKRTEEPEPERIDPVTNQSPRLEGQVKTRYGRPVKLPSRYSD